MISNEEKQDGMLWRDVTADVRILPLMPLIRSSYYYLVLTSLLKIRYSRGDDSASMSKLSQLFGEGFEIAASSRVPL